VAKFAEFTFKRSGPLDTNRKPVRDFILMNDNTN